MAAGYKDFAAGAALTAADLEDYCQNQAVMRFASVAARDAALTSVKTNGMQAYTTDASTLWEYDGTGWVIMSEPAQAFTPDWTNITEGNGGNAGYYHRSDGYCDVTAEFTMGTTSSITGTPKLVLPVVMYDTDQILAFIRYLDDGSNYRHGVVRPESTSLMILAAVATGGTYAEDSLLSSTVPMTWTTNDKILVWLRYRMATRYS